MFVLEREVPKVVKGLSNMNFTVRQWVEMALCEDEEKLKKYAESLPSGIVWRIKERHSRP